MDSINSISKGTFLFANGKDIKQLKRKKVSTSRNEECRQKWYEKFQNVWETIEEKIEKIQSESYERTLSSLLKYIQDANTNDPNLQTAVLMTGVNQIDHFKQFDLLSQKISNNCFSIVTILKSRDCSNIKYTIEALVAGLIYGKVENDEEDDENIHIKLKKKQLTLSVLEAWYNNRYGSAENKPKLAIMLADFEQFPPHVMQDLVSILCSYSSRLPIVLIIGLATAFKTLHSVLPFHITNKISVNIFQAESSSVMLNRIIDEVILTHHCPFFLSGKSFKILLDIFLFYDYSLQSFIQGFKVFMLEHYSTNLFAPMYTGGSVYYDKINAMPHADCEWMRRHCMSFRRYVEAHEDPQHRINLITNDEKFKQFIPKKASRALRFYFQFFCCLRMLAVLIEDLPRNNLGKQLRELYPICAETDITKLEEFQECFKLLRFTSKDKFIAKLDKIMKILKTYISDELLHENLRSNFTHVHDKLLDYRVKIFEAGMTPVKSPEEATNSTPKSAAKVNTKGVIGRHEMLQKLKESAINQPTKVVVEYERLLCECLDYIYEVFERHLIPFSKGPLFTEFFLFTDCNSVRRHIVGAPRSSIHNALVNPVHYLQCKCCTVKENEQILSTMPDISVAYKLHLECNKFINLFDWLQSFSMVIDHNNDYEEENITPEVQAKFTRAVAELQFLGFIKQAKQKTDHVMRLTW